MCILPLVERELRAATRRPLVYGARVLAAATAVVLGWMLLRGLQNWQGGGMVGRRLFYLLCEIAFIVSLAVGVGTTAGSICEEKRWGTLDLLILTDLRPFSVVLGKLIPGSLNSLQALLGIMPILAICLVLGGVSSGEFWRMVAVLASAVLFSLAAGMLVSMISWYPSRARVGTLALVLAVGGILLVFDQLMIGQMGKWGVGSIVPGLFQAYTLVADDKYALPPGNFWWSIGFTNLLALYFLWQAGHWLSRGVLVRPKDLAANSLRERFLRWGTGETADADRFRRRWLKKNPIFWLASRRRWHWVHVWVWLAAVTALWLAGACYIGFSGGRIDYLVLLVLPLGLHLVLKIAMGAEASRRLNELRRSGELELLLVTPLRTGFISRGLVLAIRRQFKAPILLLLTVDVLILIFGTQVYHDPDNRLFRLLYALFPATSMPPSLRNFGEGTRQLILWAIIAPLIVDLRALVWNGLWLGLRSSTATKALRRTIYRVVIKPSALFWITLPVAPTLWVCGVLMQPPVSWLVGGVIWWMVFGIVTSYCMALSARKKLEEGFRRAATMRFGQ
jgi:hypothetical protein